jgi:hypothetical protein
MLETIKPKAKSKNMATCCRMPLDAAVTPPFTRSCVCMARGERCKCSNARALAEICVIAAGGL